MKDLCTCYDGAPSQVKLEFFKKIAESHGIDFEAVTLVAKSFIACQVFCCSNLCLTKHYSTEW